MVNSLYFRFLYSARAIVWKEKQLWVNVRRHFNFESCTPLYNSFKSFMNNYSLKKIEEIGVLNFARLVFILQH